MITLTDAARNVGEAVVYRPPGDNWVVAERGVITGVSGGWVFVRYGTDAHSKATHSRDLHFVGEQT